MTVVITSWRPGNTSYLSGQRICDVSGMRDSWSCATIDNNPFVECSWFGISGPAYMTEGCYNGLTDGEKASCASRYAGIVSDSGYYYVYDTAYYNHYKLDISSIQTCFSAACSAMLCADVICEPMCYEHDLHLTYCVDGTCEQGDLIEENSYDCDYTDPTVFDFISDNKEIIALCALAGMIVVGSTQEM